MAINPYFNKVIKNGTTLIDISDTSAVAADVAQGKKFYDASGAPVTGTASGGGGGFDWSQIKQCRIGSPVSGSTTIDLDGLDTSTFTSFANMFYQCSAATLSNLKDLDTSNVTNFNSCFSDCSNLTAADLSGWDTSSATQMQGPFNNCSKLKTVTFGNDFDTSGVTNMQNFCYGCSQLNSLTLGNAFDTGAVTNMSYMFYNCSALDISTIAPQLDVSANKTFLQMFYSCFYASNFAFDTDVDLSGWNTQAATNMRDMFAYCSKMTSVDVTGWDVTHVTNMTGMFRGCTALVHLDLSSFNTTAVTSIDNIFNNNRAMVDVNLWNLDTSSVTYGNYMAYMFTNCIALEHIIWSQKNTVQPLKIQPSSAGITSTMKFYVPDDLVNDYKAATNWSTIASQIYSINDLPQSVKTTYGIS